ncbi:SitI3 family protein [Allokutzneria albata]|uniref:Uncharacterized protein n=1 Tax=Allokutzneria albata TaxID=211114 RepID=A0A1G9RRD1_ALLAB|nr:SitI3 family protein [Allokutzneria albata]SDM25714.1 hypothetical protein SAMN04489726_0626 [Allokutzneria albata]
MAISYRLQIATPMPSVEVARVLRDADLQTGLLDDAVPVEQILDEGVLSERGTWVRVTESKPKQWDPVVADLGFTPTASVTFRMGHSHPVHEQQDDMIALTAEVLNRVPGDAVLHFQFEVIWLLRRDGQLTLNERDDIWPPHRLALVDIPYRRETHAFD